MWQAGVKKLCKDTMCQAPKKLVFEVDVMTPEDMTGHIRVQAHQGTGKQIRKAGHSREWSFKS